MFRKKYDQEDKKKWVEEFKGNGTTIAGFAKKIGIPATTFRDWLNQEKASKYKNSFGKINVADISDVTENPVNTFGEAITYHGSKIKIELERGFNKEILMKLVEVIINDK